MSERGDVGFGPLQDRLARIMAAVQSVPKNHKHPHFGYMYAGVEDIMGEVRSKLAAEGVTLVPRCKSWARHEAEPQRRTPTMTTFIEMEYEFSCVDANGAVQTLAVPWHGEADDQQDKGLAKAYTMARKTFLRDFFLITIGDENDTDREHPKGSEADVRGEHKTGLSAEQRKRLFAMATEALGEGATHDAILTTLRMLVARCSSGRYTLQTYPGTKTALDALHSWLSDLKANPASVKADLQGYFAEHPEHKPPKPEAKPADAPKPAAAPPAEPAPTGADPFLARRENENVAQRNLRLAYRVLQLGETRSAVAADEHVSTRIVGDAVKQFEGDHGKGEAPWHVSGAAPAQQNMPEGNPPAAAPEGASGSQGAAGDVLDGDAIAAEQREWAERWPVGGEWTQELAMRYRVLRSELERLVPDPVDGGDALTSWDDLVRRVAKVYGSASVEQADAAQAALIVERLEGAVSKIEAERAKDDVPY